MAGNCEQTADDEDENMGAKYKCSYCEKKFIGDYGHEHKMFVFCSEQCKKDWRVRFEKSMDAYMQFMKRSEKGEESQ